MRTTASFLTRFVRRRHVYHILFVGHTQLVEVCVVSLGADGLLHVKDQLVSETCNHLQKYVSFKEISKTKQR